VTGQIREDAAIPRAAALAPGTRAAASDGALGQPQYEDPVIKLVVDTNEMMLSLIGQAEDRFALKISRLETQIAQLAGDNATLKVLAEQGRTPGPRGPRGAAGLRGEKGNPGAPGEAAKITAWAVRESDFTAVPIYVDGSIGAELRLEPLLRALSVALAKR
jgi:hypothetical protein